MSNSTLANPRHPLLRSVASWFGLESSAFLWQGLAVRQHREKLKNDPAYQAWIQAHQGLQDHWGHDTVTDAFPALHLGSQLYELCRALRERIGEVSGKRVLDAGASDGLFLCELGVRKGVGVNFLAACARKIVNEGQLGCLADVEHLPFPDGAFDIVICCETLEHVPNPVATLNELARVCRGSMYLTIPWLPNTRINSRPAGWPDVESHIFEFCEADFARILTHARVTIARQDRIAVFPEPRNPISRWWLGHWMYPHFFPRLQFYELTPVHR
jgi:SAM-dependent methyltransferase